MDQYQKYIHLSRYARWNDELQRRETWDETVNRYLDFFQGKFPEHISDELRDELFENIFNLNTMPSMRALYAAGPALERDHVAGYNCSYASISGTGGEMTAFEDNYEDYGLDAPLTIKLKNPICFDEALYVLMCGTGFGFSVERQFINNLPTIGKKLSRTPYNRKDENYPGIAIEELSTFSRKTNTIYVQDSKYGWASALRILIFELYNGNFDVKWDMSKLRPAGAKLKVFGGRSSGPEPLVDLFIFVTEVFRGAYGRKLNSLECHDIVCKISTIVQCGGIRRAALISLSNLSDQRMAEAKTGSWWLSESQRTLANNSVAYTEKPEIGAFMSEWLNLYQSKSGERGIFNREAAKKHAAKNGRRNPLLVEGTNPCGEIHLRNDEFCNLSEIIVRATDTLEELCDKVRIATILGTFQSMLTDFVYLNPKWKENCEEERLLGVSLSGIMDHHVLNNFSDTAISWLKEMKKMAVNTNKILAGKLGINQSVAITTGKPSGNVSQLVNCSSGIHGRYSEYYIRTVRTDRHDPLAKMMIDMNFPVESDVNQPSNYVFSFPIASPINSKLASDIGAIEQLEMWLMYKQHWCEHNQSITVYIKEDEWLDVGSWVYEHFDDMTGVAFLPYSDHVYQQAPYQPCSEEFYKEFLDKMPKDVDWSKLAEYEQEDNTTSSKELACMSGVCEI